MRLRNVLITLMAVMMSMAGVVSAQTPDDLLEIAIDTLNLQEAVGRPSSWTFDILYPQNTDLGCQFVTGEALNEQITVYAFTLNYDGDFRVVHVTSNGSNSLICEPIAPTATPSPTIAVDTNIACTAEDLAFSNLSVNAAATVSLASAGVRAPELTSGVVATLPAETPVMIIAGPFCPQEQIWWQIAYGGGAEPATGSIGYLLEVDYTGGNVSMRAMVAGEPQGDVEVNIDNLVQSGYVSETCPSAFPSQGFIAPRLTIGGEGYVESGGVNNNVRANYGTSGEYLGEMVPDTTFAVLAGPECTGAGSNPIVWFQIYEPESGLTGWTAESQDGNYYVAPVGVASTPNTTPTPVPNVAQAAQPVTGQGAVTGAGETIFATLPVLSITASTSPITLNTVANIQEVGNLQIPRAYQVDVAADGTVAVYVEDENVNGAQVVRNVLIYDGLATGNLSPSSEIVLGSTERYLGMNRNKVIALYNSATAVLRFVNLEDNTEVTRREFDGDLNPQLLTYSTDGNQVAYTLATGTGTDVETVSIEVLNLTQQRYIQAGVNGVYGALSLNNNGSMVAASGEGGSVYLFATSNAEQLGILSTPADSFPELAFSPDGARLVVIGDNGNITMFDVASQTAEYTVADSYWATTSTETSALRFSPDGSLFFFTGSLVPASENTGTSPIFIYNASTGTVVPASTLLAGSIISTDLAFYPTGTALVSAGSQGLKFYNIQP